MNVEGNVFIHSADPFIHRICANEDNGKQWKIKEDRRRHLTWSFCVADNGLSGFTNRKPYNQCIQAMCYLRYSMFNEYNMEKVALWTL